MHTLLVALAAVISLGNGFDRYDKSEKEDIRKTLQFPRGGESQKLVVDNISGSINVVGYDGTDIELVAHRTSYGTTDARVKESKEKIRLEIKEEPGTIVLFVNTPWRCDGGSASTHQWDECGFDADFDFELRVPSQSDFYLRTVNKGTITVKGMNGAFEVRNVNGGIDMAGITGAGLATTVNGKVEVRFNKNPESRCGFGTVNGSIEVAFPEELSADLKFKTLNGEVFSDFNVKGIPDKTSSVERIGRRSVYRSSEFFSVRSGNGGPELLFDTLNGDIRILRRQN